MRLAVMLPHTAQPESTATFVAEAESVGVDIVWVPESYGYDSPTLMGYLAGRTNRVQIGSSILNVYSRSPATIAQTAAGLDRVSHGRAILGLGASGPQVIEGFHGVAYRQPIARTRDVIDVVRQVLARESPLRLDGETLIIPLPADAGTGLGKALKIMAHPIRSSIPIYVAALGQRNVAMAAALAEGWIPGLVIPELSQYVWGEPWKEGLQKRSSTLPSLEVATGGMLALAEGDERERLLDLCAQDIALYVGGMGAVGKNFYNELFVNYGYGDAARKIQTLYLEGRRVEASALVPRDAIEKMNFIGSAAFIRERIHAFHEAGVTVLNIHPHGYDINLLANVKSWLPS